MTDKFARLHIRVTAPAPKKPPFYRASPVQTIFDILVKLTEAELCPTIVELTPSDLTVNLISGTTDRYVDSILNAFEVIVTEEEI